MFGSAGFSAQVCKKCGGKGGFGPFGPCEAGNIHWKRNCPCCNGSKVSALTIACPRCNGKGGLGTFGPCEADDVHFKEHCPVCRGVGYVTEVFIECGTCKGKGGSGAFGPADKFNVHYKAACGSCAGHGFIAPPRSGGFSGGIVTGGGPIIVGGGGFGGGFGGGMGGMGGPSLSGAFGNMTITQSTTPQWQKVDGRAVDLGAGSKDLACAVTADGSIYEWHPLSQKWVQMAGTNAKNVDIGADGTKWCITKDNFIYTWLNNTWTKVEGQAADLSVGSANHVVVVTANKELFRWVNGKWEQIAGKYMDASIGADGDLWAIGLDESIHQWNGTNFVKKSGVANQISVKNKDQVWVINKSRTVYQWNGSDWNVVHKDMAQAFGTADGAAWALAPDGEIFRRDPPVVVTASGGMSGGTVMGMGAAAGGGGGMGGGMSGGMSGGVVQQVGGMSGGISGGIVTPTVTVQEAAWVKCPGHKLLSVACGSRHDVMAVSHDGSFHVWEGKTQNWVKIGGSAGLEVAVGHDGSKWCVTADHSIFHYQNGNWTLIEGKAAQVSVGSAHHVVVVNAGGTVYKREGTTWKILSDGGNLKMKTASVGHDGDLWGIDHHGNIYHHHGGSWVKKDGQAHHVTVAHKGSVYVVNTGSGLIYRRVGDSWVGLTETLKFKSLSVANDGTMWGIARDDAVYRKEQVEVTVGGFGSGGIISTAAKTWSRMPGAAVQVSCGNAGHVAAVTEQGQVYRWEEKQWVQMPGALAKVAIGNDGITWGVTKDDKIWHFEKHHNQWKQIDGSANHITVGNASHVLVCRRNGEQYKWDNGKWVQIKGEAHDNAVGSDGETWCIGPSLFKIYRLNGHHSTGAWTEMPGVAHQVSVGSADYVYALTKAGVIFKWSGSAWVEIGSGFTQISGGSDGTVWAVNAKQEIWRYA